MSLDAVFNGNPTTPNVNASGDASLGIDVSTGQLYFRSPLTPVAGWQPVAGGSGGSVTSDTVTNESGVSGSTVTAALNTLGGELPSIAPSPAWVVPVQIHTAQTVIGGATNGSPSLVGADVITSFNFYLPFPFTFTKLGYHIDNAVTGSTVILGMFDVNRHLVFDTGLMTSGTAGSFIVSSFWNGTAMVSSITLPAGSYFWSWSGEGDPSALVGMPMLNIGDLFTSDSVINSDGITRWGHEGSTGIVGGHFHSTLLALQGGSLNPPMNAILFA
jgi:hypothetical protein